MYSTMWRKWNIYAGKRTFGWKILHFDGDNNFARKYNLSTKMYPNVLFPTKMIKFLHMEEFFSMDIHFDGKYEDVCS